MRLSAYDTYVLFLALKSHFTQESYDYLKYNGKLKNLSKNSFSISKDRFLYQKICREYDEKDILDFFVANLSKGKVWIRDFLEEEAKDEYKSYMKRKQSMSYNFANDLTKITLAEDFKSKKDSYPQIIYYYLRGEISLETFTILDLFIGFSSKYDTKYGKDDVLWSKIRLLSKKLVPFLEYDKVKIKKLLKEKMHDLEISRGQRYTNISYTQASDTNEKKTSPENCQL